jgi:hypothetical protein
MPRLVLLASCLALLAGCKDDLCKAEAPAFELELVLGGGTPASIATIEVEVTISGLTRSERFDATPLLASGHATVRVLVGAAGVNGFEARVVVRALAAGGTLLARGETSFSGSGDACNFFSLVLGSTPAADAGVDRPPSDLPIPDQRTEASGCGSGCAAGETCKDGLCELTLAGPTLSGLHAHPGKRVVLAGTIKVAPHNGVDDTESCDAGESGCLRILARQIVLGAGAVIDAAGSGYGGGGGGGGSRGYTGNPTAQTCVAGSPGGAGGGARGGKSGIAGSIGATETSGGAGGGGGGPFGGSGGGGVTASGDEGSKGGNPGAAGGYRTASGNGDSSQSVAVWVGSGGGGGGGGAASMYNWYFSVGGSGGGGAGNAGGGAVILDATERLTVTGTIRTDGHEARSGDGGNGSDGNFGCKAGEGCCDRTGSGGAGGSAAASGASKGGTGVLGYFVAGWDACLERQCELNGSKGIAGGKGGAGGAGAGGGVLLRAPELGFGGTVSSLGGGGKSANGGTVKLFFRDGPAPSTTGISAHHTVVGAY